MSVQVVSRKTLIFVVGGKSYRYSEIVEELLPAENQEVVDLTGDEEVSSSSGDDLMSPQQSPRQSPQQSPQRSPQWSPSFSPQYFPATDDDMPDDSSERSVSPISYSPTTPQYVLQSP